MLTSLLKGRDFIKNVDFPLKRKGCQQKMLTSYNKMSTRSHCPQKISIPLSLGSSNLQLKQGRDTKTSQIPQKPCNSLGFEYKGLNVILRLLVGDLEKLGFKLFKRTYEQAISVK